ncbi:unnamed protein product, partial [Iphiclides podalirius]
MVGKRVGRPSRALWESDIAHRCCDVRLDVQQTSCGERADVVSDTTSRDRIQSAPLMDAAPSQIIQLP